MLNSFQYARLCVFIKRWYLSILLIPVIIYLLRHRGEYGLIDNADLVIHEAGHFFFMFFGRFIYTLGGTLMQIILPSIIVWYFIKFNYITGIQISLLWLGQNLINISIYAEDARAMKLPLLGGNHVYHDWHYILSHLNILEYDYIAGDIFFVAAIIIFAMALFTPLIITNNK
jgi:hypothetical protein